MQFKGLRHATPQAKLISVSFVSLIFEKLYIIKVIYNPRAYLEKVTIVALSFTF